MSAIKITVTDGKLSISHEEKTQENVNKRIDAAKEKLGVDDYGICVLLGLEPNEGNRRSVLRWKREPSMTSYREMPDSKWHMLLMLTDGQAPLL